MWASAFITSRYLCLMPISHDNRSASWIEFLKCDCWLTCYGGHQIPSAYTVAKECVQFLDSGKILHFAYFRHCIVDNKVQIMGCTMYVKCERLLFMNKLLRHSMCLRHHSCLLHWSNGHISSHLTLTLEKSYNVSSTRISAGRRAPIVIFGDFSIW